MKCNKNSGQDSDFSKMLQEKILKERKNYQAFIWITEIPEFLFLKKPIFNNFNSGTQGLFSSSICP